MKRNLIVLSVAGLLVLAGATQGAVNKGEVELEVLGGWLMESAETASDVESFEAGATGGDLDSWAVMASLGRFTSKNFEIGIAGFYTKLEGDTETMEVLAPLDAAVDLDLTAYGIGGQAKWHFNPASKWVFYAGVQGFWVMADADIKAALVVEGEPPIEEATTSDNADGILWGPLAGARCELGSHDELVLEYQYHLWEGDTGDILKDGHAFFLGLAHRLK